LSPPFRVIPGSLAAAFERMCARLDEIGFADALWARRVDVWSADAATRDKIRHRLGWLSAVDAVAPHATRMRNLAEAVRAEGLTDIVLLGMGGSSLAPEVLRWDVGVAPGYPRFRTLDSVDPEAVRSALENAATSLFILASKSGTTIEPNVMAAEARRRLMAVGVPRWAQHFVAITDEHTALHQHARDEGFREIFINPSDIGGRYSALSLFGMVPATLMGADVDAILAAARKMETACRDTNAHANPGLALGAFMAAGAGNGRDKLTVMVSPPLAAFGLWLEQLVAESTGKQGKGVVPVLGCAPGVTLGPDRIVVAMYRPGGPHARLLDPIRSAGVPVFEIEVPDEMAIGAEFLRWEVATATAGLLMGINPFDEPNVSQAKEATRALLEQFRTSGRLPRREPHGHVDGATLTLSRAAHDKLRGEGAESFLRLLGPGDYAGLLAYLPPDRAPFDEVLHGMGGRLTTSGHAATVGYGPRYLHSTGQLHKGGANNGVFVIVTADPAEDLPIPDETFSFGVLEMAQALGDFESLDQTGRRALHVHLPKRDGTLLQRVFDALLRSVRLQPDFRG
jgi:glucose-6-phosphate isomerase